MAMSVSNRPDRALASLAKSSDKHVHVQPSSPLFGWYIAIIIVLVLLGGVFSGLTLGLMGLDSVNLQVLSISGTPSERRRAPKVLKLLQSGRHTMLVVLLLGNTLVNTSLPIFLDSLVGGGVIAVLASTGLELIFGAVCNRYGLAIGSTFAPLVRGLIVLAYPIAKPIGMLLDHLLGAHDEGVTYRKAELKTFVALGVEDKLNEDELTILGSVLEFSGKTVQDIMTPRDVVFSLSAERIIDADLVSEILRKGYSRIPVHESGNFEAFIGVVTIRGLVEYDPSDLRPASSLVTQALPQCPPDLSLLDAMNYFQTGQSHILLISSDPGRDRGVIGIVTLEDVVEELIGKEIIDETDQYIDVHSRIPVIRPKNRDSHGGLKRIIHSRSHRRRLDAEAEGRGETGTGILIDHAE